jgi:hypothetical protein
MSDAHASLDPSAVDRSRRRRGTYVRVLIIEAVVLLALFLFSRYFQ